MRSAKEWKCLPMTVRWGLTGLDVYKRQAFEGYQVTVMKVDDRRVVQIKVVRELQEPSEEE